VNTGVKDLSGNLMNSQWTSLFGFSTTWTQQLGTSSDEYATGVATDSSDNVYITGNTEGGLDGNSNAGDRDLFVLKYNSSGTKQWTQQLGTSSGDYATGVATDSSGNVYAAGGTSGGLDGNTNQGKIDLFLVKFDLAGNKQWTKQLGTSSNENARDVATDFSGNVYVAGSTLGGLDGNTNPGIHMDLFLTKYNSSGTKQWTQQLGTPTVEEGTGVATDSSGNIYVSGYTWGILDGISNVNNSDPFIVKYNANGNKQWSQQIGSPESEAAWGVASDSAGNAVIVGATRGGLDGNTNSGEVDFFAIKFNSSGNKQWTRQMGTSETDSAKGVASDSSGNVYVVGWTSGGLDGNSNSGGEDIFVVKYSVAGVKQWTQQFGSSSNDMAYGVVTDSSGNVYVAGSTSGGLDGYLNSGGSDIFVIKYNASGVKQ